MIAELAEEPDLEVAPGRRRRAACHAFPAGIWTFGGPRSAEQVLDAYVDLLTG